MAAREVRCPSDNCPDCLSGPYRPNAVLVLASGSVVGFYICWMCGRPWSCSWSADAVEAWAPPADAGDAA